MNNKKRKKKQRKARPNQKVANHEPEVIGPNEKPNNGEKNLIAAYQSRFQGPIPDPETLAQYKNVDPDAVKWILESSTAEREHRHKMELSVTTAHFKEARYGQFFAFGSVLTIIGCAAYMSSQGQEITAGLLGVGGIATIVGIFIYGRDSKNKENNIETTSQNE